MSTVRSARRLSIDSEGVTSSPRPRSCMPKSTTLPSKLPWRGLSGLAFKGRELLAQARYDVAGRLAVSGAGVEQHVKPLSGHFLDVAIVLQEGCHRLAHVFVIQVLAMQRHQ